MYIAKQETKSGDQSKGKYIYLCLLAYTFLILSLPDGIKNMTCLYKICLSAFARMPQYVAFTRACHL